MRSHLFFKLYMIHSNIEKAYTIGQNTVATFDYNCLTSKRIPTLSGIMRNISSEEVIKMISEWIHGKYILLIKIMFIY